jgi:hypothetical protein
LLNDLLGTLSECLVSITRNSNVEDKGLESFLMVMWVASKGGRSLKVVDPSAACQEKIVSPVALCDTNRTVAKIPSLGLENRKKCDIGLFLASFSGF